MSPAAHRAGVKGGVGKKLQGGPHSLSLYPPLLSFTLPCTLSLRCTFFDVSVLFVSSAGSSLGNYVHVPITDTCLGPVHCSDLKEHFSFFFSFHSAQRYSVTTIALNCFNISNATHTTTQQANKRNKQCIWSLKKNMITYSGIKAPQKFMGKGIYMYECCKAQRAKKTQQLNATIVIWRSVHQSLDVLVFYSPLFFKSPKPIT